MNFLQRLSRYLIGVAIGVALAFMFFGQRSCDDWTPQNRVTGLIAQAEMKMDPKVACELDCQGFSSSNIKELVEQGKVNFDQSQVKEEPKTYRISNNEIPLKQADFEIHGDSIVWVVGFEPQVKDCDC